MIGRLKGVIASVGADQVLIDVGGVGYVAAAGGRLLSRINPGEPAELHVETQMSESAIRLYAFESDEARAWFARLQDVPGVGAKAAMAVLDALDPAALMDAIALGDAASVTRAKGVGKKLAERIVGELSGKPPPMGRFGAFAPANAASSPDQSAGATTGGSRSEAVSALVNLGYAQTDAARAVAAAAKSEEQASVEALIKGALKELAP